MVESVSFSKKKKIVFYANALFCTSTVVPLVLWVPLYFCSGVTSDASVFFFFLYYQLLVEEVKVAPHTRKLSNP